MRRRYAIVRALLLIPVFLALMAPAEARKAFKPNSIRIAYVAPKNPAHQPIHDRLRQRRVLERLAFFLSPLRLPRTLLIKVEGCDGEVNAHYEDAVVTVCYEYLAYIRANAPKESVPGGLQPDDAVIGPTVDVFLHEVGHAVFDMLEIPVLGREEDAADLFSAYLQLQISKPEARTLMIGNGYLGAKEVQDQMSKSLELKAFADTHGLPAQRYFNVLCMAYGSDPVLFADAIRLGRLPPERAEDCEEEYEQFERAFKRLIEPYIDRKLLRKVKARKWLNMDWPK